jgi:hypothetical protein
MLRNRIAALTLGAALVCGLGARSASAQGGGVNNCTLLTDPTLLRQCVERVRQGGNVGAGPSSSQDAFSPHRTGTDTGAGPTKPSQGSSVDKARARGLKLGKGHDARPARGTGQPRDGKIP